MLKNLWPKSDKDSGSWTRVEAELPRFASVPPASPPVSVKQRRAETALKSIQTSVFMQLERERYDDVAFAYREEIEEDTVLVAKTLLRGVNRASWAG